MNGNRLSTLRGSGTRGSVEWVFDRLDRFPDALLSLLMRLAVAGVFFRSGQLKFAGFPLRLSLSALTQFRNQFKVPLLAPEVAATLTMVFELTCPVLIVIGLATRLATLPLLAMTAVIEVFVFPNAWPTHIQWAALLIFILVRGPGPISLDAVIWPWLSYRRGARP